MKLGIVILNWNGRNLLNKFLPSLIRFTPSNFNIYIIDNCSSDKSVEFITKKYINIKIIKLDKNYGFAKGYNMGLKDIDDEILCLINNDVEVTKDWTKSILNQFKNESKTGVIQPKMMNYYKRDYFDYAGAAGGFLDKYGYPYCRGRVYNKIEKDNSQYDKSSEIFWACGACFFIRNKLFKEMSGFDELFWAHMEEIDLCWRIKNNGYSIKFNHESIIYHLNAATLKKDNPHKTYLNFRNKLFMLVKNSKNNIFILLLEKFFIDLFISVYILISKGFKHFLAIFRAYFSLCIHINLLLEYRKKNKREIKHYEIKSIILYYLKLKR